MKAKRRNLISLAMIFLLAAFLAKEAYHRSQDPALHGDPNQLVVETSYSHPWHDELVLRRGPQRLFKLKQGISWGTGGTADQVLKTLGPPQYRLVFLATEYWVWDDSIRYDWDFKQEHAGHFVSIGFDWEDCVDSVTITPTPPLDAAPTDLKAFQNRESKRYKEKYKDYLSE